MARTGPALKQRPISMPAPMTVGGAWAWFIQRVTAALIFIFVAIHIWALHFVVVGAPITFENVRQRMQSPLFIFVDLALLAVATYHALYGIRGVLLDFESVARLRTALSWGLIVIGLVFYFFGVIALWPFIAGKPLI